LFFIEPSFKSGRRRRSQSALPSFAVYVLSQIEIDVLTFITGCLDVNKPERRKQQPDEQNKIEESE
jgi:hypothetical protein